MPQGDKSSYTGKQKRQAEHIEKSYRRRGVSQDEAEERAWRTVNKQTGGGKKKKASRSRRTGGSRKRSSSRKSPRSRSHTTRSRSRSRA